MISGLDCPWALEFLGSAGGERSLVVVMILLLCWLWSQICVQVCSFSLEGGICLQSQK